jgi:hypothetical protein
MATTPAYRAYTVIKREGTRGCLRVGWSRAEQIATSMPTRVQEFPQPLLRSQTFRYSAPAIANSTSWSWSSERRYREASFSNSRRRMCAASSCRSSGNSATLRKTSVSNFVIGRSISRAPAILIVCPRTFRAHLPTPYNPEKSTSPLQGSPPRSKHSFLFSFCSLSGART